MDLNSKNHNMGSDARFTQGFSFLECTRTKLKIDMKIFRKITINNGVTAITAPIGGGKTSIAWQIGFSKLYADIPVMMFFANSSTKWFLTRFVEHLLRDQHNSFRLQIVSLDTLKTIIRIRKNCTAFSGSTIVNALSLSISDVLGIPLCQDSCPMT